MNKKEEKLNADEYEEVNFPFLVKKKFTEEDIVLLGAIKERIDKVQKAMEPFTLENLFDYLMIVEINKHIEKYIDYHTVDDWLPGGMYQ